jgi:regulator of sirC expression with transglutaminase-like and TPR domain
MELNYSNQPQASLQVALKLTEIMPENPQYVYAVATNYRKLGDKEKAREFYSRTVELMPFSVYASRARAKLRELEDK